MQTTSVEPTIDHQRKRDPERPTALRQFIGDRRVYFVIKRGVDLVSAMVVIVLVFPILFPLLMLCIRLDSRGPVFFKQKRVGFLGRTFWCYKFRTMFVNKTADTRQAVRNDPRVTRIGRILRQTGLDELPQFVNVLLGHMSMVGPRPHMLKDSHEFSAMIPNYRFRHLVRPGITGMSQIRGCRGPASTFQSIFRRYQWDVYYTRNIGFGLDLSIMIRTVGLMIRSIFREDRPETISENKTEPVIPGTAQSEVAPAGICSKQIA